MTPGAQLQALADPTRRAIFDLVLEAPSSVRGLSDRVPVSQPAVSQHLRVLRDASLVRSATVGARHIYTPDPHGIATLRAWIDGMWDDVMDAFVDAAHKDASTQERRPAQT